MVSLDATLEDVIAAKRGERRAEKSKARGAAASGKGGKGSGKASRLARAEPAKGKKRERRAEEDTAVKLDMSLDDMAKQGRLRGKGKTNKARDSKDDKNSTTKQQEWTGYKTVWSGAKKADGKDATAAKLDMSLEDMIEKEVRPKAKGTGKAKAKGRDADAGERRAKRGDKGRGKSAAAKKRRRSEPKRAPRFSGHKLWSGAKLPKERQAAKKDSSRGGRSTARRVDWDRSADGRRAEDLAAENARLARELAALRRAEREEARQGAGHASWTEGGSKRARAYEEPASAGAARSSAGGTRVKVSNLPRDLDWRDIKDAFEQEAGKIAHCEMVGNQAWLSFVRAADARRAVETFDRGQMNGRCIGVALDA